jgi:hypothetical protein
MEHTIALCGQNVGFSFNGKELTNLLYRVNLEHRYGLPLSLRAVGLCSADTLLYTPSRINCVRAQKTRSINNGDVKWAVR